MPNHSMSNYQSPHEPYPMTPISLDEVLSGGAKRVVALAVYVELSPDSPPEDDAAALLRALHHATLGDISDHIVEGPSEASAHLTVPERPSANANLLRAITTDILTARQKEVASLIGELTGPEIAARLDISHEMVRTTTKEIYRRLKVNNRMAAAAKALGFLGTPEEANNYWAGLVAPCSAVPAELPAADTPKSPLQPRQREILRRIFDGETINTLAIEFETNLEGMRRSLQAIARRLGLDENTGARALQKYLQDNITEFDFLRSEQP